MNGEIIVGTNVALPKPPPGWFDHGYSVLMDGTLGLLRTDIDMFANCDFLTRMWSMTKCRAMISSFDGTSESTPVEVHFGFAPTLSRLADGRWLVVSCRHMQSVRNARLYAADGSPAGAFPLGDAIEHVRCAPDGTIWVGYFDEGVFSRYDNSDLSPLATAGIAQYASDGTVLYTHNSRDREGACVDDCYAMSLSGNSLWTYFYSSFPVVRIEYGEARYWSTKVNGAIALAVGDGHVLLAGGYKEKARRLFLLRLGGKCTQQLGAFAFEPPESGAAGLVQGQGAALHVVARGQWTQITVASVIAARAVKIEALRRAGREQSE